MSDVIVRPAGRDDLSGIRAVDETFRLAGTPEWSLMSTHTFETLIDSGMVLVACTKDACVGYLAWSLLWGFPFIDYVRLVEEHRGRGTGTRMVMHLVETIRARGYRMIWSSTQDARALEWHEKNGFTKVGSADWIWGGTPETFLMKEI